ncbi:asparagine synthase (glutamine-hydrolyzing) [Daejeonella sp.]|uniref:asparagine synthase (glutamine-hydrolyzing) n=1 Tax=Daejeonella sp. TaxID=2805397 RepID=UPI0030C2EEC1
MCGIAGIISKTPGNSINLTDNISHRGPDDKGTYSSGKIQLFHTRLSIQDVSSHGHQPMVSNDGRYVIIFNGEIYNHWELRVQLAEKYNFISSSDTETILYGYVEYRMELFKMLNGIFSLCIYDEQTEEVLIIRDQFGVKPLYIYQDETKFVFASELKALLPFKFNKEINAKALANYLTFLWSPGSHTPFRNVSKLPPGHFFHFKADDFQIATSKPYYQIPFAGSYFNDSEETLINMLEEKLIKAVKRQMLSDVPVGFFLSGGLDSSLLVAIARKLYPEAKVPCFTIDTDALSKSEGFANDLDYAKIVAEHLNVELNIVKADSDILANFDKMIWHLDEPQADAAPINVLNICTKAREQGIKVLIGGTGGDDLFSGYRRHQALALEKFYRWIPRPFGKLIKFILSTDRSNSAFMRRAKKLVKNIDNNQDERLSGYFEWLSYSKVYELFAPEFKLQLKDYNPLKNLVDLNREIPLEGNVLNKMLYWELKTFLVDHNLNYTDKLSMAVGVEVRVPYLDIELVEFSTKIPPELKMKGSETKYILKKVAERYLPHDIIYRSKAGFGAPVRKWINEDLSELINSYLGEEQINARGIFNPVKVRNLIVENKSGKIDASYSIWALLAIESWMRQFVDPK